MLVQFISEEDRIAAELIQKQVGGTLYKGYLNPSSLNDNIIIVGGPEANSLYQEFINIGIFEEVTETTPGTIFVRSYNGYQVYGVAGYYRTQTIASAEYIFLYGLPSTDTIAGDLGELVFYEIFLFERSQGAFNQIIEKLAQLFANINNTLPSGYNCDYIGLRGNILEILIRKETSLKGLVFPFIPIAFAIMLVLIGVSILVGINNWTSKDIKLGKAEIISKEKLMTECMLNYECQYADDINKLYPEKKTNWIIISLAIAGLGLGVYYVVTTVTPAVKKKYAKAKTIF